MNRKQIANILNEVAKEELGTEIIFAEDLSDVVDIGKQFMDIVSNNKAYDSVIGAIINKIGKTIIVDRTYSVSSPDILRDAWEYGSILEKIRIDIPDAKNNDSWGLESGKKYDDILVYDPPEVSASYWNKRATFDISVSYPTEYQLAESFKNGETLNRFFSGIANRVRTGMTFYTNAIAQRTVNNLIICAKDRRINLLSLYNKQFNTNLSVGQAWASPEFFRFAAMTISMYSDYMTRLSVQFNNGTYKTFTPKDYQHFIVLSAFAKAVDTYSLSDTYHNEFVKLIKYETVPYWQGVAAQETEDETIIAKYDISALSRISATPADGNAAVTMNGVVGVLFDRDAATICNENERVTSFYNPQNETTKYYYKWDCAFQNDLAENCIVFTIEPPAVGETTTTATAGTETVYGVTVSTIQTGLAVVGDEIAGTLNYLENGITPTGTLSGAGHFMSLDFANANADGVTVELVPSISSGAVVLDSDKRCVFKVSDKNQIVKVVAYKGNDCRTQIYSLKNITLASPS